jgi:hypothetical protein
MVYGFRSICHPFGPACLVEAPQGNLFAMLLKLELARGQASLAGWVVSKPAQCTSAAYTTEQVAAQHEQHKQLCRCKKTQRMQDQRDRELSQVQAKPQLWCTKVIWSCS